MADTTGAGGSTRAPDPFARKDPPLLDLTLWPNRSLSRRGFAWVLGIVAVGLAAPIVPLLGTRLALGVIPFSLAAFAALYFAIRRSYADGRLTERIRVWPDLVAVERREPRGGIRRWQANPHWVRLALRDDGPVERYLTLSGGGREIELGAFLSPEERESLHAELARVLARARAADFR
ncbi:DUF2244 domain-containing protein [Amaricoccus solimangrovi]|uniref:DUF2244 domain-containing protein n=1 Tax=Amaricoccus solimangrovi TaxID=2589815 RepID=A0A501WUE5_9RHOB|nr:DUF2244 domain-containing protein [Amaricoccus solimangrovi]TPE52919.1 DUF2244 domain-containing protein [Amaricoccus solimangrovi]